eukprot:365019-Chlamydomonas_euryale.AAC.20
MWPTCRLASWMTGWMDGKGGVGRLCGVPERRSRTVLPTRRGVDERDWPGGRQVLQRLLITSKNCLLLPIRACAQLRMCRHAEYFASCYF